MNVIESIVFHSGSALHFVRHTVMVWGGVSILGFFLHLIVIYSENIEFFPRCEDSEGGIFPALRRFIVLQERTKKISGKAFGVYRLRFR